MSLVPKSIFCGVAVRAQADAPAEEGIDQWFGGRLVIAGVAPAAEVEERRAIEEEVPPLREKQREASEVGLPLIDLGLREVGVHREHSAQEREWDCRRGPLPRFASRSNDPARAQGSNGRETPPRVTSPYGLMSMPSPCVTSRMPVTWPAFVMR